MTILLEEEVNVDPVLYVRKHEAPAVQTRGAERTGWRFYGEPCFDFSLQQLWGIYSRCPDTGVYMELPCELESEERASFIRNPSYTLNTQSGVVGGAWIDTSRPNFYLGERLEGRTGLLHINVNAPHRGGASSLLRFTLNDVRKEFEHLEVSWGSRLPENDPSDFLERHGFEVDYGSAILHLNAPKELPCSPAFSARR
jgi:hypothetical protein